MVRDIVLMLDPRGVIYSGGQSAINRQKIYRAELHQESAKKIDLVIFSASHKGNEKLNAVVQFLFRVSNPTFNFYIFAKKATQIIKRENFDIKLLVVGDPWESYWSAFFLNKFLRLDIPIQIQIHGDIGNPNWYRMSLINYLRFNLAKLSIPRASAVRCVGYSQAKFVLNKFNIRKELLSVIPIPISTKLSTASSNSKKVLTLGLVGRIDHDRGIKNFLRLITCLNKVRQDFSVVIIGTGPELFNLKKDLGELLPAVRVIFAGELPAKSLQLAWSKINVLISMAQSESYGRAMREALVAGVPVWATKSSGVEDLISMAGKDAVRILDLKKSNHELSKELDQLLKSKVPQSFRKQFIKDNSTYAQLLAKSWVDLINKQKL